MPKGTSRPRLTVQDEQAGACVELPYYTENPEPDEVQCALAWYTGAFADRERQLGVEVLLDALLGTNNSPLKAALLAENRLVPEETVFFGDAPADCEAARINKIPFIGICPDGKTSPFPPHTTVVSTIDLNI